MGHKINIKLHIVICPKFRQKNLTAFCFEYFKCEFEEFLGVKLLKCNGGSDHIHLLVDFPSTVTLKNYITWIKCKSSKYFTKILGIDNFRWSSGYFACSIGDVSESIVSNYISNQ